MRKWESEDEREKKNPRMRWRRGGGLKGRRRFVWIFFSRLAFFLALFLWYEYMLYDTTMLLMLLMMMVAMSWNEKTGKKCYIQMEKEEEEGEKNYIHIASSLSHKSHTFSTIICMFSEAPWMLYVLPHFLSMDITWKNIHVYKFCSLHHSWTHKKKKNGRAI